MFDSHALFDPQAGLGLVRAHHRELSEDYRRASRAQRRLGAQLRRLLDVARSRRPLQHSPRQVKTA